MFRILSFLILFALLVPAARAEEIPAESKLRAVTVYSNRAMLTRRAVIDIPAGAHRVVFTGLPVNLLTDSLRAEGKAAAEVKFGALTHRMVVDTELIAPREKELTGQLEALNDQRNGIVAEKASLEAQQKFLATLAEQGALRSQEEIAEINLKPDQWAAAASSVRDGMAGILKAQLAHDVSIRNIDKEMQKIRQELSQLATGRRSTYEVALPLESSAPAKLTVDISYQIPDATWSPLYDARLDTKDGTLELVQFGAVRQMTGEDWEDVDLTLSTAQPQRGAGLPDLDPMWVSLGMREDMGRLSKAQRVNFANVSTSPMMAQDSMAEMADGMAMPAAPPAEKEAQFSGAIIDTGGFVSEYRIPGPSTVKADGTESKLMIGTFDTDNEIRIQVKPQMSAEAYLVAHTKLKGEAPILAGPVSLFRDGAFVGQAHLPLLRPGQESDLAFGVDDQISVKRRTLKDERGEAGMLAKDSVIERHFVTEIENLRTRPVKIVVLETVPESQNEQIRSEVVSSATTPDYKKDVQNVKGLLRWEVPLAVKQKSEVKLGWRVSWPKGENISGI